MSRLGSGVPYALFFFSGISGLVYEVVWVRQFGNVFGNTVASAPLVTAVFMCGLGAGSWLAGAWADRRWVSSAAGPRALLAAYGWSEILIGALGVALALALPRLGGLSAAVSWYTRGAHGWSEVAPLALVLRNVLAAVLLLPMTLLMGGTLTLLVRCVVRADLSHVGLHVGVLYGVNTAGAALGCFLTDFSLVPTLGIFRTQLASASINVVAGAIAVALAGKLVVSAAPPAEGERAAVAVPAEAADPPADGSPHAVALTAVSLALSGFAGMGVEIVWFRFLGSALGGYRSVFSLLLTVILVGMWLGATLAGVLHRRFGRPARAYLAAQVLLVVATLALLAVFDRAAVDRTLAEAFQARGAPEGGLPRAAQVWAQIRAIVALVGPPSVLMGSTFPLANAAVQRLAGRVGRRAGALYVGNTLGSVLGSLTAGFVLLPALGTQGSVLVLMAVASAAVVPLYASTRRSLKRDDAVGPDDFLFAGGLLTLVIALCSFAMLLAPNHLRKRSMPDPLGDRVLTVSEGTDETLAVSVGPSGDRQLWTNGHSMSTTSVGAQRYMRAFAHIPLLQMDAPRRALVICFGVGNTANAASLHDSIERVDVVDLSRNVLEHAPWFAATNGNVLESPKVSVFVNDGRQHLRMTAPGTYDLVTLEPPPIAHAGVSSLYSREMYELVKSRLAPGGWLTQWLPINQLDGAESLSLVRAFVDAFPASALLSGDGPDLVLIGTTGPKVAIDADALARRLRERPRVAADLERVQLGKLSELVGTFVADADTLRRATAGAAPVTDDAPSMEYSVVSKLVSLRIPPELFDVGGVASFCPSCRASTPGLEDLAAHLDILGRLYRSSAFLHYRSFAPLPTELDVPTAPEGDDGARAGAILRSAYLQRMVGIDPHGLPVPLRPKRLAALEAFVREHTGSAVAELRLGLALLADDHVAEALPALERAAALAPTWPAARFGHALALRRAERAGDAVNEYRSALQLSPRDVPGHLGLAAALDVADRDAEVGPEIARVLELDPGNGTAHRYLCAQSAARGAIPEARAECRKALEGGATLDMRLRRIVFGVIQP